MLSNGLTEAINYCLETEKGTLSIKEHSTKYKLNANSRLSKSLVCMLSIKLITHMALIPKQSRST